MKTILFAFMILCSCLAHAQIKSVSLRASGLTCSMCSNAINKALKTLDFVERIDADIQSYTFQIRFKDNANIDFDRIKDKVENAGFAVSAFTVNMHLESAKITDREPVVIDDMTFRFPNTKDTILQGNVAVKILNKGFVSGKKYKNNPVKTTMSKTYHASL